MAKKYINLEFGDGVNANTITEYQIDILQRIASDPDTEAHISGIVFKEYMLESEKYMLERLGLTVQTTIILDTYSISPAMSTVNEGHSTQINASNINSSVLEFSLESVDITGENLTAKDIANITKRITVTSDGIVACAAAQENLTWNAIVTVKSRPVFSEDNIKTCQVTFQAIAFSGVTIQGKSLVSPGEKVTYTATILPVNSTKRVSSVSWECLQGSINQISGIYIAPQEIPSDVISAVVEVYGRKFTTNFSVLIDTDVLNDTTLNPKMFDVIKKALNLDKTSLTVSDCGAFSNSDANAIWLYLASNRGTLTNAAEPISFSEFKYFTGVSQITVSNWNYPNQNSGNYLYMDKLEFPTSIKTFTLYTAIYGLDAVDFSLCSGVAIYQQFKDNITTIDSRHTAFINPKKVNLKGVISGNFSIVSDSPYTEFVLPDKFIESQRDKLWIQYQNSGTLDISYTTLSCPGSIRIWCPNVNTINLDSSKKYFCGIHSASLKYFISDGDESTRTTELPDWMTGVYDYQFQDCSGLEITSFNNLKTIGYYSFAGCTSLKNMDFSKITSIGERGLADCVSLTCDNFGAITSVGNKGFYNCISLENTSLDNITSIGSSAFYNCTNLKLESFGKVSSLGDSAFYGCVSCTFKENSMSRALRLWFQESAIINNRSFFNNCLSAFSDGKFTQGDLTTTISYMRIKDSWKNTPVKKLTLLGNNIVSEIQGGNTRSTIDYLKIIDIRTLTNLTTWSFSNWDALYFRGLLFVNLTNINKVVSINMSLSNAFGTDTPIYVPDNLVDAYKAATNWNNLPSQIFGLSQFKIDAVTNGWGTVDSNNNWILEPEDNDELLK